MSRDGVYTVRRDLRNTSRVRVPDDVADSVRLQIEALRADLGRRFGRELTRLQRLQFLSYAPGQFFKLHHDAGDVEGTEAQRRVVSIVTFLNSGEYAGGTLVLHGAGVGGRPLRVAARRGQFIAFPSSLLHEVTPITEGTRFSVASWFEGSD